MATSCACHTQKWKYVEYKCHRTWSYARFFMAMLAILFATYTTAAQTDIHGPSGSVAFGTSISELPNGNIVVTDPSFGSGGVSHIGAVYLYSPSGGLLSTLTGASANDNVGSGGITVLANGNYVIRSPLWHNPDTGAANAGAVTWANASSGVSGVVSPANSLVGTSIDDVVGEFGVIALSNGNYVVDSASWNNGAAAGAGAVTWGNGISGITGAVSAENSLVGSNTGDGIGAGGVQALIGNGNYVVSSAYWHSGGSISGAVTWGDGSVGTKGVVSTLNSLTGTAPISNGDPNIFITPLTNGNYVVSSPAWTNDAVTEAGAATWANGGAAMTGSVSVANSLVGTHFQDKVGNGIVALSNGNYAVESPFWNGQIGAVTWGSGAAGTTGAVAPSNSLIGSTAGDTVGGGGVVALTNGNYVVASLAWHNGSIANAGAATWVDGSHAFSGIVTVANSLVGGTAGDAIGSGGVTALTNGNYVVNSVNWNNNTGAVTWGNGSTGIKNAVVTSANSLLGNKSGNMVGFGFVTALVNGNYVVSSPLWDNGGAPQIGAVTWGNGSTGVAGLVSPANSLIGATAGDSVGGLGPNVRINNVAALSNGNYVVGSPKWDTAGKADVGAATLGDGSAGTIGSICAENSLIGSTSGDEIGVAGAEVFGNGTYAVWSALWDNSNIVNAGAVTFGRGSGGTGGIIDVNNSVLATTVGGGGALRFAYDPTRDTLVVGQPASNIVSMFQSDSLFEDGFQSRMCP